MSPLSDGIQVPNRAVTTSPVRRERTATVPEREVTDL
jgi:hypothetical protein